jgi:hypothetical protein
MLSPFFQRTRSNYSVLISVLQLCFVFSRSRFPEIGALFNVQWGQFLDFPTAVCIPWIKILHKNDNHFWVWFFSLFWPLFCFVGEGAWNLRSTMDFSVREGAVIVVGCCRYRSPLFVHLYWCTNVFLLNPCRCGAGLNSPGSTSGLVVTICCHSLFDVHSFPILPRWSFGLVRWIRLVGILPYYTTLTLHYAIHYTTR